MGENILKLVGIGVTAQKEGSEKVVRTKKPRRNYKSRGSYLNKTQAKIYAKQYRDVGWNARVKKKNGQHHVQVSDSKRITSLKKKYNKIHDEGYNLRQAGKETQARKKFKEAYELSQKHRLD